MGTERMAKSLVVILVLVSAGTTATAAETYRLDANGDQLEFTEAPESGYVVKLAEQIAGIHALVGISILDAEDAKPIGGPDRQRVWIVEKEASPDQSRDRIQALGADRQVAYAAPLFSSYGETVTVLPEIVVRVKPGVEMEDVQRLCEVAGCIVRKPMEFTTQEYLVDVLGSDAEDVFAAVETLSRNPGVEWACPNIATYIRPCGEVIPNDEYFPIQWSLCNTGQTDGTAGADIAAPEAWGITTGDPNVVIAVVDSGVDVNHPDLIDNLVSGYDFWEGDDLPMSTLDSVNRHGTACAGLISARGDNIIGIAGVTWNCKIMPIRIATWPDLTASSEIASAFRWAAANGADVLSNSWTEDVVSPIIYSAIVDVTALGGIGRDGKGCVLLAAAGNDGGPVGHCGAYAEVISIGATDHDDQRRDYSNFGPKLDIVAPGGRGSAEDPSPSPSLWTADTSGEVGRSTISNK